MVGIKDRKREVFFFFFVEVKRPHKSSKYQPEDNYCKLMEHLKSSIDIQLSLKIEDPVSLGILCEGTSVQRKRPNICLQFYIGFLCSLIRMTLVEDGIYLPVVIRKFMFPESLIVSLHIPIAVEYFSSVSVSASVQFSNTIDSYLG